MRIATDAIVLRVAPHSESSQIVHLLTAREGRVTALARGAMREKSAYGGPLDLLVIGRADLTRRKPSDLDLIHAFRVIDPLRGLRRTLPRWAAACHVLELVLEFAWPRDLEGRLFDLVVPTLRALCDADEDEVLDLWLAAFAARLLTQTGFAPRLDACVECGSEALGDPVAFAIARGGVVCPSCVAKSGARAARTLSRGALDLLRRTFFDDASTAARGGASITGGDVTASAVSEVRTALDRWLEARLERPLAAQRFLGGAKPERAEVHRAE